MSEAGGQGGGTVATANLNGGGPPNGGQGGAPAPNAAFLQSLPDEYRADPAFAGFDSIGAMAKSLKDTQSFLGHPREKLVKIPLKEDDKAGWQNVHKALGWSEDKSAYKLEAAKDAPPLDAEISAGFVDDIHELGGSVPLAQQLYQRMTGRLGKMQEKVLGQIKAAQDAAEAELKTGWGGDFDTNMGQVHGVLRYLEGKGIPLAKELDMNGLGDKPQLIKALHHLAGMFKEGDLPMGDGGGGGGASPEAKAQAQEALKAFDADPENAKALRDSSHKGHRDAVQKRAALVART